MKENLKLSLGPFQGITDQVFRTTYTTYFQGIDKFYTPFFTSIQKDKAKNLQTDEIAPSLNNVETLTPQILSNDAAEIIRFSEQCANLGYNEININIGCPFQRVARKKRGSGLLPYPEILDAIFAQVFQNISTKLSVKCRFGYNDSSEIFPLIDVFNSYPISELIVHARIGKQLYKGTVDTALFEKIIPLVKAPLIYNGDIFTVSDFKMFEQEFESVNSFMLGRGLLSNPFLASEIKEIEQPESFEKQKIVHAFVVELFEARLKQGRYPQRAIGRMKELWSYLIWSFDEPQHVWRKIKKINDPKLYTEAVEYIFSNYKWLGNGYKSSEMEEE
ncbi:MAG: tRNA-dihydrouridine synthase family protein [Lentimicrobiaceae bacterium]|jgi:tRNA-dihydrouridine synthase|nr:tRNA-dihydrouridine synthase family protein [Lentimicrobiaceae bacterium]